MRRLAFIIMLGVAALGSTAQAHPDILIDDRVTLVFEGAAVTAIEEIWTFDSAYSEQLLALYDTSHHGQFSAPDARSMGEEVLGNLREYRYFTFVWVDGKDQGLLEPRDFAASVAGKRVTFRFVVDLKAPVDPRRQKLKIEIYDRENYAGYRLVEKDAVRLRGAPEGVCVPRVRDDVENPYFGYVYPQEITLICGR